TDLCCRAPLRVLAQPEADHGAPVPRPQLHEVGQLVREPQAAPVAPLPHRTGALGERVVDAPVVADLADEAVVGAPARARPPAPAPGRPWWARPPPRAPGKAAPRRGRGPAARARRRPSGRTPTRPSASKTSRSALSGAAGRSSSVATAPEGGA